MSKNICVIGSWHLASVYANSLAKLGHNVIQSDCNDMRIKTFNSGKLPFEEKGLPELLNENLKKKRITFTSNISESINKSQIIFLADDIPVINGKPDTQSFLNKSKDLLNFLNNNHTIVISTQIPIGTCSKILEFAKEKKLNLNLAYQPEFLRLGDALSIFLKPDYIVLGCSNQKTEQLLKEIYKKIKTNFHFMSVIDAEMLKHVINSYVAMSVSFSSEISKICDAYGVDAFKVGLALKDDKRVGGKAYVLPGLGFTGGNLERDINVLKNYAKNKKIKTILLDAITNVNILQGNLPRKKISTLNKTLFNNKLKNITILGLSYKPGSNSIKGSYAISLAKSLIKVGFKINAYDPLVTKKDIGNLKISLSKSLEDACNNSELVAIMNNDPLYSHINLKKILEKNKKIKVIFDSYGIINSYEVTRLGLNYSTIGKGYDFI